jgi:hypothetical protein
VHQGIARAEIRSRGAVRKVADATAAHVGPFSAV